MNCQQSLWLQIQNFFSVIRKYDLYYEADGSFFIYIATINCAGQVFKTILIEFEKEKKTTKKLMAKWNQGTHSLC